MQYNPDMKHACPRCGRILNQDGEIDFVGRVMPTFTCGECMTELKLGAGAESIQLPYTFALDGDTVIDAGDAPPSFE